MKELLPDRVQQLLISLFSGHGHTPSALRHHIVAYGENVAGVNTAPGEIPTNLAIYLDKVTRAAYKVTDKDISQLKEDGYSEAEIYEITLSVAVGAGLGRMERGLMALHGLEQD